MNKINEIEVLLGSKGYVDLAYPIEITKEKKEKFLELLEKIYNPKVVLEKNVDEFKRDWRIGEKVLYSRPWTEEEYEILFDSNSVEEIAESLGRSPYASGLKDADWRYKLISFCDKHGLDLSKGNKLIIIRKFMKAQEEFNKFRKELRKEKNKLKKDIEEINSPERGKRLELLKVMGKIDNDYLNKENEKKDKKLKRIKEIEKELNQDIDEFN